MTVVELYPCRGDACRDLIEAVLPTGRHVSLGVNEKDEASLVRGRAMWKALKGARRYAALLATERDRAAGAGAGCVMPVAARTDATPQVRSSARRPFPLDGHAVATARASQFPYVTICLARAREGQGSQGLSISGSPV
jgi:hypothetical protein